VTAQLLLILGGTGEAAALARAALARFGGALDITTSLAGRTRQPSPLPGRVRIGGFGGPAGLAAYLTEHSVDRLIDATHPFAARISTAARSPSAHPTIRYATLPEKTPKTSKRSRGATRHYQQHARASARGWPPSRNSWRCRSYRGSTPWPMTGRKSNPCRRCRISRSTTPIGGRATAPEGSAVVRGPLKEALARLPKKPLGRF